MTNVIIAGSRDFNDALLLSARCSEWAGFGQVGAMFSADITVISGDASGADKLGAEWADFHGLEVRHMPADWDQHGRAAGPIRNAKMAEIGDVLLAFWDGKSKGTKNMIENALRKGLEVHVWRV